MLTPTSSNYTLGKGAPKSPTAVVNSHTATSISTDPTTTAATTTPRPYKDPVPPEEKLSIKGLLGTWERRAAVSDVPDIARLGHASMDFKRNRHFKKPAVPPPPPLEGGEEQSHPPPSKKSTRKTIEDLSRFASPRVVQKSLVDTKKKNKKTTKKNTKKNTKNNKKKDKEGATKHTTTSSSNTTTDAEAPTPPPPPPPPSIPSETTVTPRTTKRGSVLDRCKAFESPAPPSDGGDSSFLPPWGVPFQQASTTGSTCRTTRTTHGRRSSSLDKFTPKASSSSSAAAANEDTPLSSFSASLPMAPSLVTDGDDDDAIPHNETSEEHNKQEEPSVVQEEDTPMLEKWDRDKLVLDEINKMIRDAETLEIEDDMEEEVKQVLVQAAIQSDAYSKRWYDCLNDSWIHCPSLATIIMDFTMLDLAEELYGEELPFLYTVSLRAIAAEVAMAEEEIPDYVYKLAI